MDATVVLPIKRFSRAKTRLADAIGAPARAAILKAMLTDTLTALDAVPAVERLILITGEGRAERVALHASRRLTLPIEVLQDPTDAGHSQAATLGIVRAKALGAKCAALLAGDCPLLDPGELGAALARMAPGRVGVVPDRHGTGTNGLLLAPADAIGPAYGEDSHARHLDRAARAGYDAVSEALPSLQLDLDTPDDLEQLRAALRAEPERAPATAAALAEAL